ncbi:MAG: family peptidase [Paenibacillaceae bacterium]|jgi:proteasome lid subunit RPN8/RPN11|nr:family peptidase [Paenibacillaceae bacterium]
MDIFFHPALFREHHRPDSLAAACRQALPRECCGILTGQAGQGAIYVEGFQLLRNTAATPETAFAFDPAQWVETVYRYARAAGTGPALVGLFHSHPQAPAVPSAADMESLWDTPVHLIISLQNNKTPDLRCYLPREGRSWEEQAIRFRSG